jgi:acyl-CoA synthetase (NDP forming)
MLQRPSLQPMFNPASVALIGASDNPTRIGGRPIAYWKQAFHGPIYPVNPRYEAVQGLPSFADITQVPGPVDLCIVSVPAAGVVPEIERCAAKGVKAIVLFSSGFAEMDDAGGAAQQRIGAIAREAGMRIVGPNCLGVVNVKGRMAATFSTSIETGWPVTGPIGIACQSGAMGAHAMTLARERGIGVSYVCTTGNECDVTVADAIDFYVDDPDTKVIVAYLEACNDPPRMLAAFDKARAAKKPIVMLKVGGTEVGAAAAQSHTASLAGSNQVFDAAFRQYGVCRVPTIDALFDTAYACTMGVFPSSNRLGIVTISGGGGVLLADAAVAHGLEVPALPKETQKKLKALIPYAGVRNPVDTTAQVLGQPDLLGQNMDIMLTEGGCDIVTLFLSVSAMNPTLMQHFKRILPEVKARHPESPIVMSSMTRPDTAALLESIGIKNFEDPTRTIAAIANLVGFGRAFAKGPRKEPPKLPRGACALPTKPVGELEALQTLASAGVPTVDMRLATSAKEAAKAARAIGFPVALKIASADIAHKSDVGGVMLRLADAKAVEAGYATLVKRVKKAKPKAVIDGVLVAPMVSDGVEVILGVNRDPTFGPVVMFGLGGVLVEVLKDVTFRLAPFGEDEAHAMIREVKGYPILNGVRGAKPADVNALAKALARLSVYAAANAEQLESIDINPLIVRPRGLGAVAVDALIAPRRP